MTQKLAQAHRLAKIYGASAAATAVITPYKGNNKPESQKQAN